jgi:hypothetical protein
MLPATADWCCQKEIKKAGFQAALPKKASPSEIRVRHRSREFIQADAIQGELMIALHQQM